MPANTRQVTSYVLEKTIEPTYSGGKVWLGPGHVVAPDNDKIKFISISSGRAEKTISGDGERVTSLALAKDATLAFTTKAFQLYTLRALDPEPTCRGRIHVSPGLVATFDPTSTILAIGFADSSVRIFNVSPKFYPTHVFPRRHDGTITALHFFLAREAWHLASAGQSGTVIVWDLAEKKPLFNYSPHDSIITGMDSYGGRWLYTCSRDQTVCIFDSERRAVVKTVAMYEELEAIYTLDSEEYIVAGRQGRIRRYEGISEKASLSDLQMPLTHLAFNKESQTMVACYQDMTLTVFKDWVAVKRLVGSLDQVLSCVFLGEDHLAVASNGPHIYVFDLSSMDTQVLSGHKDTIMTLVADGSTLVSGSRDSTIRIWKPFSQKTAIAVLEGHTGPVGALAFRHPRVFSGAEDLCIKCWDLGSPKNAIYTTKAHEKGITFIAVHKKSFVLTASLDKTLKLWDMNKGSSMGVLKGHRRPVYGVAISISGEFAVSASGDKTMKIWDLKNRQCVRTLEGHLQSVLALQLVSNSTQIISVGSDGLLKLWGFNDGKCILTEEAHNGKIWCLSTGSDMVVTGGEDSTIKCWRDNTEQAEAQHEEERKTRVLEEQDLVNALRDKDVEKAFLLCVAQKRPFQLLQLIEQTGNLGLGPLIEPLDDDMILDVVKYVSDWNTTSQHAYSGQRLLSALFPRLERMLEDGSRQQKEMIRNELRKVSVYSDRHLRRLDEYLVKCQLGPFVRKQVDTVQIL